MRLRSAMRLSSQTEFYSLQTAFILQISISLLLLIVLVSLSFSVLRMQTTPSINILPPEQSSTFSVVLFFLLFSLIQLWSPSVCGQSSIQDVCFEACDCRIWSRLVFICLFASILVQFYGFPLPTCPTLVYVCLSLSLSLSQDYLARPSRSRF